MSGAAASTGLGESAASALVSALALSARTTALLNMVSGCFSRPDSKPRACFRASLEAVGCSFSHCAVRAAFWLASAKPDVPAAAC